MRHRHIFRQSLAYLIPELTVCVTAKKVRCRRESLQHFSILITPRFLGRKQQRLRPLSWRFACRMPKCVSHFYNNIPTIVVKTMPKATSYIGIAFSPFNLRPTHRQDASLQIQAANTAHALHCLLSRANSRHRPYHRPKRQ